MKGGESMAPKRNKKKKSSSMGGFITIFAVVITLALVAWNGGKSLQDKIDAYEVKKEQLQEQIAREEQRTLDLEEKKKYIQTKQYIEQIAKEKFGLIYKDEVVFKPSSN